LTIPSHPQWDEHECIRRQGKLYGYTPVSTPGRPTRTSAGFYSVPGWYCGMSTRGVWCEYEGPKGETVRLSPDGKVAACRARATPANPNPCGIGNSGLGAPSLSPGKQVTVPPFRCTHSAAGLTCVVIKAGRGFLISNTAVARVGP
jgi:hypothetical protein